MPIDIDRRERFTSIVAALEHARKELEAGRVVTISPSHDKDPWSRALYPNGDFVAYPEKGEG